MLEFTIAKSTAFADYEWTLDWTGTNNNWNTFHWQ